MKKINLLIVALFIALQFTNAQTADNKLAIGLGVIRNEYNGDYGNGIFDFSQKMYPAGGLTLSCFLSPSFDLGLQGSYGNYGYTENENNRFDGRKADISLFTHYKLNNGYILKKDSRLSPFISLGVGMATYSINKMYDKSGTDASLNPMINIYGNDLVIPVGLGLKYQITSRFAIQYQYLYSLTNRDNHDEHQGDSFFGTSLHPYSKSGNDAYGQHVFSLVFNFGKAKDTDKDGVSDKYDKCPNTPTGVRVDSTGCALDSDGDGVPDNLDKCPDSQKGAKVDANGCEKDTDGDGVADYMDKCPGTPAAAYGKVDINGCPLDTDGDGIPDYQDNCPKIAGVASNNGCPEVKKEVKTLFQKALQGIQFETGKADIKPISFPLLNQIANALILNPDYLIEVQGHTDNVGGSDYNINLSNDRAASVRLYLVDKGVTQDRITSKGYGYNKPVASNKTKAGKAMNRRVEFVVTFEK